MREPTSHEARIIRELTENEFMNISNISMNTGLTSNEVRILLDEMVENGYAVEVDNDEWTLIR